MVMSVLEYKAIRERLGMTQALFAFWPFDMPHKAWLPRHGSLFAHRLTR